MDKIQEIRKVLDEYDRDIDLSDKQVVEIVRDIITGEYELEFERWKQDNLEELKETFLKLNSFDEFVKEVWKGYKLYNY
jgi:hypothetical protein